MIPNDQLLTELALPAYAGMDETAKATAINAKNIVTYHTVSKSLVLDYLIKQDLWPKIEGILLQPAGSSVDTPLDSNGTTLRLVAEETKTYYTSADLPVDDQDAKLQQLVGVFQATGVFTAQQVSDFNAQFQTLISRAEQLGGLGMVVSAAQITAAEQGAGYAALSALVDAPWQAANDLRNTRYHKIGVLQGNGTAAPADLATLDATEVQG